MDRKGSVDMGTETNEETGVDKFFRSDREKLMELKRKTFPF